MRTAAAYSPAQIALHWLIALGIAFNYIASGGMGRAWEQRLEGAAAGLGGPHVWVGVAVLVLALVRLGLRLAHGAPPAAPGWSGRAAQVMHGLLYLLILAMPLAGLAAWFGGVEAAGIPHKMMANLLMLLAALHALAALTHHFVLRDGTLRRMIRPA